MLSSPKEDCNFLKDRFVSAFFLRPQHMADSKWLINACWLIYWKYNQISRNKSAGIQLATAGRPWAGHLSFYVPQLLLMFYLSNGNDHFCLFTQVCYEVTRMHVKAFLKNKLSLQTQGVIIMALIPSYASPFCLRSKSSLTCHLLSLPRCTVFSPWKSTLHSHSLLCQGLVADRMFIGIGGWGAKLWF